MASTQAPPNSPPRIHTEWLPSYSSVVNCMSSSAHSDMARALASFSGLDRSPSGSFFPQLPFNFWFLIFNLSLQFASSILSVAMIGGPISLLEVTGS